MSAPKAIKIPLPRTGGNLLKDGVYKVRVDETEVREGPSGFPYISLTLAVLDRNGKPLGGKVWDNLSLGPKARFKIDQILDALEAETEGSVTPNWFKGKVCWVRITSEPYQGVLKNKIDRYLTPEQAEKAIADSNGDISGTWAQEPLVSAASDEDEGTAVESMPEEMADDDIPF